MPNGWIAIDISFIQSCIFLYKRKLFWAKRFVENFNIFFSDLYKDSGDIWWVHVVIGTIMFVNISGNFLGLWLVDTSTRYLSPLKLQKFMKLISDVFILHVGWKKFKKKFLAIILWTIWSKNMYNNRFFHKKIFFTSFRYIIVPSKKVGENWHFCATCEAVAPPRSWHCNVCNVCILKRWIFCNISRNGVLL